MAENKERERNAYREKRDTMDRGQVEALSLKLCAHLTASDLFAQAEYLYAYFPLGNEADIRPAVETAWQQDKRVAFPKVFGEEMRFFEVADFAQMEQGAFGIMEPSEAAGAALVDWRTPENRCSRESSEASAGSLLVLVPGVAFDHSGYRLGFGKGYYDRHFAACCSDVTLLGVAYAFQITEALPVEPHDLRVSHLLTEDGIEM